MVIEDSSKRTNDPWDESGVIFQAKLPRVITHNSAVMLLCLIKLSHTKSAVDLLYELMNFYGNQRPGVGDRPAVNRGQCFCCCQCRYTYYII